MKTKTIRTKVALLGLLVCGANAASASSLVITGGEGNPEITRFTGFGKSLTASVIDPPKDTEEATISGPKYQWSGGGSGTSLAPPLDKADVFWRSDFPRNYGGGGQKNVGVSCTATYTSTDKKTGVQTPIPVSGNTSLQFFVLVPDHVEVIYGVANSSLIIVVDGHGYASTSPRYNENGVWGSLDDWHLWVKDNKGGVYQRGTVAEEITPPVALTGHGEWTLSTSAVGGLAPGEFVDGNGAYYGDDPGFAPSKIECDVQQKFSINENGETLPLNGQHPIVDWYGAPGPKGHLTSTHTG